MNYFIEKVGQDVLINGFGIGTDHFGGFSEKASVRNEWLMPLPSGLSHLEAAKIGTAGYTAMLCVDAIKQGKIKNQINTYIFFTNHICLLRTGLLVLYSSGPRAYFQAPKN